MLELYSFLIFSQELYFKINLNINLTFNIVNFDNYDVHVFQGVGSVSSAALDSNTYEDLYRAKNKKYRSQIHHQELLPCTIQVIKP